MSETTMAIRASLDRHIAAPEAYGAIFNQAVEAMPGASDRHVREVREARFRDFRAVGFPGPKVEEWKYAPLGRLAREAMQPAAAADADGQDLAPWLIQDPGTLRLVFVNGRFSPSLSTPAHDLDDGLRILTLAQAIHEGLEPDALRLEGDSGRSLTAFNAAFATDGVVIHVADGIQLSQPVQILFVSAPGPSNAMINPRNVVRLGKGASLAMVETHLFQPGAKQLVNLVNWVEVAAGASLDHDRIVAGAIEGSFIGRTEYRIGAKCRLRQSLAVLGGRLVRNEVGAILDGSGIDATFNGLFFADDDQHLDHVLQIDHAQPDSESNQFYKGVLAGRSKAGFAGKIIVRREAQKTNAFQSNNNLLLSPDAEINSKPELEIYADDVKCSHGATSGEIDDHELFYLRSRGIDPAMARTLLTFAFAEEVLDRFGHLAVQEQARRELRRRLPGGDLLDDQA